MKDTVNNNIDFADKLYQLITGELSEDEAAQLLSQINDNPQLKEWFDEFRKQENLEKKYEQYNSIDLEQKWEEYNNKLHRSKTNKRFLFARVAAVVFLILSVSTIIYLNKKSDAEKTTIANELPFIPGSQKAILTVSGEKQYDLSKEDIKDVEGILNNDGKLLAYEKKEKNIIQKVPQLHTLSTPRGGEYQLTLEDGTKIWVNAESEIQYYVPFADSAREVIVKKGEVFFEVTKNGKPFHVNSRNIQVNVLGTAFNVRAYGDEHEVSTTLVEGKVEFIAKSNAQTTSYNLEPGNKAWVKEQTNDIIIEKVNINQTIAWREGWFYFEDKTITEIMRDLSRWYDFSYSIQNAETSKKQFSMKVKRFEELSTILDILSRTGSVEFQMEGEIIMLK